jgi:hypothetical protein
MTRSALVALFALSVSAIGVVSTTRPSYADGSAIQVHDPIADPGSGPRPGDPDGPTGDLPNPSTSGNHLSTGTGVPSSTWTTVPERRFTIWAQMKVALKLWVRSALLY